MGNYICDYGHINKSKDLILSQQAEGGGAWRCLKCDGKLQTSPGIEALCARYETRTFKVVECAFEEQTIQIEHAAVMKGPIEGVLLVVISHEQAQNLASCGGEVYQRFVTNAIKAVKSAGWDGEVMVISEDMKFARFEVMEL